MPSHLFFERCNLYFQPFLSELLVGDGICRMRDRLMLLVNLRSCNQPSFGILTLSRHCLHFSIFKEARTIIISRHVHKYSSILISSGSPDSLVGLNHVAIFAAVDMPTVIIGPHMAGRNGGGAKQRDDRDAGRTNTEQVQGNTGDTAKVGIPPAVNVNTVERDGKKLPVPVWNRTMSLPWKKLTKQNAVIGIK